MIADCPPGLIRRFAFPIEDGERVCIEEHRDLSVPGSPMIRSPWVLPSSYAAGDKHVRQVIMSAAEYAQVRPRIIEPAKSTPRMPP